MMMMIFFLQIRVSSKYMSERINWKSLNEL